MTAKLWPSAAPILALVALIVAGCGSSASSETGTAAGGDNASAVRDKALRFAACMRDNGVAAFPDPDASGEMTLDGVVNGSSLDTSSASWKNAIAACKDLQPPGFTGRKATPAEQDARLRFAQCMREKGVRDFPDPTPDGPLIDTTRIPSAAGRGARDIPGFDAATHECASVFAGKLGRERG